MKTLKMQEQIVRELFNRFEADGFAVENKTTLILIDDQKNTTRIATKLDRYGMAASLGFWVGKRYDQIETLVEKYIGSIDPDAGKRRFTYTLRFCENDLKGKHFAGAGYTFDGAKENIGKLIDLVAPIIKNKLLSLLEKLRSYQALHEFINDPPETFQNNAYFFSKDGMTPLRKMIIAKIVNKDYAAVCDWVLNDMIELRMKPEDSVKYERYKNVYFELKKELEAWP